MTPTIVVRFDLARTLIKNRGTSKLWSRSVNRPINHCDRDARARVSLRPGLVEVVVGKVGLIGCGNGIRGLRRGNGNCDKSQGES